MQSTTLRFPEGNSQHIVEVAIRLLHFLPQCIMEEILSPLRHKVNCGVGVRLKLYLCDICPHQLCKHFWVRENFSSFIRIQEQMLHCSQTKASFRWKLLTTKLNTTKLFFLDRTTFLRTNFHFQFIRRREVEIIFEYIYLKKSKTSIFFYSCWVTALKLSCGLLFFFAFLLLFVCFLKKKKNQFT